MMWNLLLGELGYHDYDEDDDPFYHDDDGNDYRDYSDSGSYGSYLSCDDYGISGNDLSEQPIFAAISESRLKDLKGLIDSRLNDLKGLTVSSEMSLDTCFKYLSHAVSCNQMVAAKLILSSTCRAFAVSTNRTLSQSGSEDIGKKLLVFAADRGNEKVVKFLLNEGIVSSSIDGLWSCICSAVQRQFPQIVEHLLIHGADVNSPSPHVYGDQGTLLHYAVNRGSESIVKLLINFGADVNATITDESTPLHPASQEGFLAITEHYARCSPLQAAIQNGHKDIVKLLLDNGADVNARDSHGKTVFQYAVGRMCPEILTYVLNYRPLVNDENGKRALHSVICSVHTEKTVIILKQLLQYGFALNSEDMSNLDLLFSAVRGNFFDVTKLFLENGVKVNELYAGSDPYFSFCSSLLHVAVIRGDVDMIKLLMDHGANPDIKNAGGKTPLLFAVALSDSKIAKFLLERKADVLNEELLVLAAEKNSLEVVRMIVEKGIDLNKKVRLEEDQYEKLSFMKAHGQYPHFGQYIHFDIHFGIYTVELNRDISQKPKTALDAATSLGRHEVVKLLLEYGADIDCTSDHHKMTLLSLSAHQGHFETVKLLLEKGANINAADTFGKTALHLAAKSGHLEVVKLLLEHGAETNATCEAGNTALFIAVEERHLEVVEVLLNFGADVTKNNNRDESVLDVAIRSNSDKVMKLLLEYGAKIGENRNFHACLTNLIKERKSLTVELLLKCGVNINARNSWERSLLCVAAQVNSKKLVQLLLDHNSRTCAAQKASAFVNFASSSGETALHVAAERGGTEVVKVLLMYGAFVNCETLYGATPLFIAAEKGYLNVVQTLIEANADVNCTDKEKRSPLYNASNKGRVRIVRLLLKCEAASDIRTCFGETPLSISARKGHLDIVKALINSEAAINPADEDQSLGDPPKEDLFLKSKLRKSVPPLYNAAEGGHLKILKLLLRNGAATDVTHHNGETPLSISASKGHFKTVKALLKAGSVVNSTDGAVSPLCNATRNNHVKVVELLLESGATTETKDGESDTPLLIASKQKSVNLVKTLLTAGANIESSDVRGKTALHHAIRRGHHEIAELLLQHGAKVDSRDVDGRSPLIISVQTHGRREEFEMESYPFSVEAPKSSGHEEVKLLLKYGADVDAKNTKGETPLFISAKYGQLKSVKALLEAGANTCLSDSSGRTPLHVAATQSCSKGIVKILLEYGTEIDSMTFSKLKIVLPGCFGDRNYPNNSNFYHDTSSNGMDLRASKILAYHFVKMKTVDLFKGTEIFKALNIGKKTELNEFQQECESEVIKMMGEFIGNTNVSFYEILKKNIDQLAVLAENDSVVKILTTADHRIKFPIFADIIDIQIQKGELRKNLLEQGVKLLYFLINEYADLPYDVVEKILRYLSVKDLRMFIHACKPIEVFLSNPLVHSSSLEDLDLFD